MHASRSIMMKQGVQTELLRVVDLDLAPGVMPDMTEHGAGSDGWPSIYRKIQESDIIVIGSPIWLGEMSSVCRRLIERLYSNSSMTNERGQYAYYGKVGGCIVTGNEDGVKHVAQGVLFSLQHIGFTVPPGVDAGWIGEAGPGPSYGDKQDDGSLVGMDNEFTQRSTTFMTWNLLHFARLLKDAGGVPTWGNHVASWDDGERFGFENPTY